MKIKIGDSWGPRASGVLTERVALAPPHPSETTSALFVDANGGYSVGGGDPGAEHAFREHGVIWFEEPVSVGLPRTDGGARVRARRAPPMWPQGSTSGGRVMRPRPLDGRRPVDCLQLDVTRCGGYSAGWPVPR